MKPTLIIAFMLLSMGQLSAQPFPAPCPVSDSIVDLYQADADRLALARTFGNGTPYMDSIAIDPQAASTALSALAAVYNSTLPARDTVVDLFNIHVFPTIPLRVFYVRADSTLPWMQQLRLGNIPTGTPAIDNLLATYGSELTDYNAWTWLGSSHLAVFSTPEDRNLLPLCALFAAQPGVVYAEPNGGCCDGNTITDSVHVDHVNIVYSHGWADCPSGCIMRRYWEFNVHADCTVEYVGSYGSPLVITSGIPDHDRKAVQLFPNPAADVIHCTGIATGEAVTIIAMDGREVLHGTMTPSGLDVRSLPAGLYGLKIGDGSQFAPMTFLKR